MKPIMLLGTCRVHDPFNTMPADDGSRSTQHRLHTPLQILEFMKHMVTGRVYSTGNVHFLSDYAMAQVFAQGGIGRNGLMSELDDLRQTWSRYAAFVIEISSLKEFEADGQIVNTFSRRDCARYRIKCEISERLLTGGQTLAAMRGIKEHIQGRPIVWVSHIRMPSTGPEYEIVNAVRLRVAQAVESGAKVLGDTFFDPTSVASDIGPDNFFREAGDLDHLSPMAAEILGRRYRALAAGRIARKPKTD